MEKLTVLIKFGEKEHLETLQKEGLFYCKEISYFLTVEDGELRGDEMESIIKLTYMENPIIEMKEVDAPDSEWLKLNATHAQLKESNPEPLGNLFCMSAFQLQATKKDAAFIIDQRFKDFGGYALIVNNESEFINRINLSISKFKFPAYHKQVEYLDLSKYTGSKNLFQKDLKYSFQQEYRIFLQTGLKEPFTFKIGNIEDITYLFDFDKIRSFQFKLP